MIKEYKKDSCGVFGFTEKILRKAQDALWNGYTVEIIPKYDEKNKLCAYVLVILD